MEGETAAAFTLHILLTLHMLLIPIVTYHTAYTVHMDTVPMGPPPPFQRAAARGGCAVRSTEGPRPLGRCVRLTAGEMATQP